MGTNWKLNSVFNGDVELSKEDTYRNIRDYAVPEDRMLMITARLKYRVFHPFSRALYPPAKTQTFAGMVSSNFLRERVIRYLELECGQFNIQRAVLRDFDTKLMVKTQWGSHQLQISREDNGQSPFAPVDSAVYSENNSVRVRVFEVGLELSDDVVTQSAIADDSVGLEQLAHGTANKFLGFDESGNPVEKDGLSSTASGTLEWRNECAAGESYSGTAPQSLVRYASDGNVYICTQSHTSVATQTPSAITIPGATWQMGVERHCLGIRSTTVADTRGAVTEIPSLPVKIRRKNTGAIFDFYICVEAQRSVGSGHGLLGITLSICDGNSAAPFDDGNAFNGRNGVKRLTIGDIEISPFDDYRQFRENMYHIYEDDTPGDRSQFENLGADGSDVVISLPTDQPFEFVQYPAVNVPGSTEGSNFWQLFSGPGDGLKNTYSAFIRSSSTPSVPTSISVTNGDVTTVAGTGWSTSVPSGSAKLWEARVRSSTVSGTVTGGFTLIPYG